MAPARPASLPPATRPRGSPRAGYLLVETLATLAISAAILAGLASVLGLVLRTGDRTAARGEAMEASGRTVAAVAREIRQLARVRWSGAARRSFVFAGEPDRILFARRTRGADGLAETDTVVLQSVGADGGGRLLRAVAALPTGAESLADLRFGAAAEVYRGPSLIRLAYFGRSRDGGTEILTETWPAATALPVAIRIGVVDPATGRLTSSLRVPVLVDAEPGCADPKTGFCSRVDQSKPAEEDAPAPDGPRADAGAKER